MRWVFKDSMILHRLASGISLIACTIKSTRKRHVPVSQDLDRVGLLLLIVFLPTFQVILGSPPQKKTPGFPRFSRTKTPTHQNLQIRLPGHVPNLGAPHLVGSSLLRARGTTPWRADLGRVGSFCENVSKFAAFTISNIDASAETKKRF